jgi:hypothetical protein
MIGIGGLARSGKNTLADSLKKIIKKELGIKVEVVSLARELKKDLNYLTKKRFGISSFTEVTGEKEIIRPILVAYGESMKHKYGDNIWLDKLIENKKPDVFYICADVRFDFEAKRIKDDFNGAIVHISRHGYEDPPNAYEAENNPKVLEQADVAYCWPTLGKNIKEADSHASIIWQMIPDELKQKWKTI